MPIIYDLTNLFALVAIGAGVVQRYGWEIGAIVCGVLVLLINQATAWQTKRVR
jgi:hypothetical protein